MDSFNERLQNGMKRGCDETRVDILRSQSDEVDWVLMKRLRESEQMECCEACGFKYTLNDEDLAIALEAIELAIQGGNDGVAWRIRAAEAADRLAAYLKNQATTE